MADFCMFKLECPKCERATSVGQRAALGVVTLSCTKCSHSWVEYCPSCQRMIKRYASTSDSLRYCRRMSRGTPGGLKNTDPRFPPPHDFTRAFLLTSVECARLILERRRLRVSQFCRVNDPFELMHIKGRGDDLKKRLKTYKAAENRKTGLLCFSSCWHEPVLWSHYADRHKGVCLAFDVGSTLGQSGAEPVDYISEKLDPPVGEVESLRERLLLTKHATWKYEDEIRVIVALRGLEKEENRHYVPFSDMLRPRAAILGVACPMSVRRTLERLLSPIVAADGGVHHARLGDKRFEIKFDENDGRHNLSGLLT